MNTSKSNSSINRYIRSYAGLENHNVYNLFNLTNKVSIIYIYKAARLIVIVNTSFMKFIRAK